MPLDPRIARHLGAALPPWDADEDDVLVCRAVRQETHDVKSFLFTPREPKLFAFAPGQFLTFTFDIDGQAVERCYTLASAPTRPHVASITVKRVPGGPVSGFLHDRLRPGMEVRARGPLGRFSLLEHPAPRYLFLSGGSGITPLMSMSRSLFDLGAAADVVFVHSARSPEDLIFRDELVLIARHLPGFRLAFVCETEAPDLSWSGYMGRLSLPMLRLIAPDLLTREVFTCGPAPYMAAVRAMLDEAGFDRAHYHEESFDLATLAAADAPAPAVEAAAVPRFRVEFAKSKRVIDCDAGTPILLAAQRAGMRLPFACAKGLCGTCKSRLVSGAVDMQHQGGIRQREIDAGHILICCSRPKSDLVIER